VLKAGPAKKVSIYVGEDQQYHGHSVYAAILDFLFYRGVSGATIMRGIAGFGSDRQIHTTRLVELAQNLPVKIEFIETTERVEELLPKLHDLAGTGLIEIQETTVVKPAQRSDGRTYAEPVPSLKTESRAKLMRIFFGENDKWHGKPLQEALVEALRANEIAGVTVSRGILGYGANRRVHKDKALNLSHDRPIMVTVIDTEAKLAGFTPILDQMLQQGLVALSDVDVVKYTHNYKGTDKDRRREARR
jgi:PII-like signaling protein